MPALRISIFSVASAVTLLFIAIVMLMTLLWNIRAGHEPYDLLLKYTDITEQVQVNLRKQLDDYLASGNAVQLTEAETELNKVSKEQLTQLPADIAARVIPSMEALQNYMATDLRSSGKLAGDPQALLLHAESEIANALGGVLDYAEEGKDSNGGLALQYAVKAGRLQSVLKDVALAREKYFASGNPSYRKGIEGLVNRAQSDLDGLSGLPRLGVKQKQEVDDFAAAMGWSGNSDDTQTEDKVEGFLSTLHSNLSRYLHELGNTDAMIAARNANQEKTKKLMADVETNLTTVVPAIDEHFKQINSKSRIISFVSVGLFLLLIGVIYLVQRNITNAILRFVPYLSTLAKGDLRTQVTLKSRFAEVQLLESAANELRGNILRVVQDIRQESEKVKGASEELTRAFHAIRTACSQQEGQAMQSTTAVNEMTTSFQEVANNASRAASAASGAEDAISEGEKVLRGALGNITTLVAKIDQTSALIGALETESKNIESVLLVIENIAEQTNLLALNAAIEAARAGEQGRSFAVVADEVRDLAQKTTRSTQAIKSNIDKLQHATRDAVSMVSEFVSLASSTAQNTQVADKTLNTIVGEVSTIREMNDMIAIATEEQLQVASEIDQQIVLINQMTGETSGAVDSTIEINQRVAMTSLELLEAVKKFTIA